MEEGKKEEKKCELCKNNATNVCFDCLFYLCDSCSKYLHGKKVNASHKKDDIDPFISIDIKCPDHPKMPMNIFCLDDKGKINIYKFLLYSSFMPFVFF